MRRLDERQVAIPDRQDGDALASPEPHEPLTGWTEWHKITETSTILFAFV